MACVAISLGSLSFENDKKSLDRVLILFVSVDTSVIVLFIFIVLGVNGPLQQYLFSCCPLHYPYYYSQVSSSFLALIVRIYLKCYVHAKILQQGMFTSVTSFLYCYLIIMSSLLSCN